MGLASAAVGALALAWRSAAPFPLRRAAWCVSGHGPAGPPHPALHASPRLAALRAAAARGDGPAAVAALGFPQDGRCAAPLADVPAYRLEALVGRRLSARARRRVLAALALPSSLDAGSILSRTPSSSAPCSPPSPDGGEGAPLLGHAPGTPAAAAAASARPHGAAYEFERLEFLGDAVLEVAAREWALARFPRASEHVLSNAARGLVCGRALLAVAASPRLRLDVYVAANAHAMADGRSYLTTWAGPGGVSSLVDAFEALVGALYLEFGLDAAAKWALAAIEEVLDPARLGLELNSKALLILTAADHTRISYKARQARGAAWDGHSSSHPVLSSARIGEAGAAGATSPFALPSTVADAVDADAGAGGRGGVATAGRPPRDGGPPPAPPLCWEVECYVDGRLAGHGVDVHRSTAEQAAAREALVGVFGVQADEVWRERVADQL